VSVQDDLCAVLRCPDDGGMLGIQPAIVTCQTCRRGYQRPRPEAIEMIASKPQGAMSGVSKAFYAAYLAERSMQLSLVEAAAAWGAPGTMSPGWVRLRRRYSSRVVNLILRLFGNRRGVVLDTSAGAGYVTFGLAERGVPTIHADLDRSSIAYALGWLDNSPGSPPLLALRADYFALPARGTIDAVVATDSLIRGRQHELAALQAIRLALTEDGFAVVDFHNWLHNPLRRLGLLPDNFKGNRSYLHGELPNLVRAAGLKIDMEESYHQEDDQPRVSRWVARLVPPTRFVVVLRKDTSSIGRAP